MPPKVKLSKEQRSDLHDVLYDAANAVLKATNPCGIHIGPDGKAACHDSGGNSQLCCSGCQHLTPTGCGVHSLTCKLWLCHKVKSTPNGMAAFIGLEALRITAGAAGINMFDIRKPKEHEINERTF